MKRHAVLIANGSFRECPALPSLETPGNDLDKLAKTLAHLHDGGFAITPLRDHAAHDIYEKIEQVLDTADGNDLILIYYSGHGLLNDTKTKLSLATSDTKAKRATHREIAFDTLASLIKSRRSTRVLVLLDCCHSG